MSRWDVLCRLNWPSGVYWDALHPLSEGRLLMSATPGESAGSPPTHCSPRPHSQIANPGRTAAIPPVELELEQIS